MGDIERIESARGDTFQFRLNGQTIAVAPLDTWGYQDILGVLDDSRRLLPEHQMAQWKRDELARAWAAHHDLPDFLNAQRLCYLVDHYASALTFDLHSHAGVDLIELWQARRWKTLLDIIDRLPPYSSYGATIANDPEHAEMLAKALERRKAEADEDEKSSGPSVASWTPEVDVLTGLRDDVRTMIYTLRAANGDKTAKPPKPLPRPTTALERATKQAEFTSRKTKHDALVARMLPHKQKS